MKLLLFSDLHADTKAARHLTNLAAGVDVLVGAGDFGNLRQNVGQCLKVLRTAEKPAILVAGNNESTEELQAACADWPAARVLHGSGVLLGGTAFFGIGGGIPVTPFGPWSYDFSEEEAETLLTEAPPGCVLVTHSPPRGVVDLSSRGQHLGSTAIRAAIERIKPALVVCGHIHGSAGQCEKIGSTPVVNAGPEGVLWHLEQGSLG